MAQLPPNPALKELAPLIGSWEVAVPQFPGPPGAVTFEWLEGGAYLRFHATVPDPAPTSTWIIGRDDASETCTALYYDSRGVSRVYRMTFGGGVWKLWREAPGFWERFTGALRDGGGPIRGAWGVWPEGAEWRHEFHMV